MIKHLKLKDEGILFLFALPGLAGLLVFYVVPFLFSFYYTLIDNNVTKNFVGLRNFIELFTSGAFTLGLKNTGIFMAICVPANIIFPLAVALMLHKITKLKNVFGLIFLLPLVIPSASVAHFWRSVFGLNGIINGAFFADAPVNWLNTDLSRVLITIVFIWKNAGFNMILFLAGLKSIPKDYYEYASVAGAGTFTKFFRITLVYLSPTTFLVFIMSIINSFKSFKEIYLICGAYPHQSIYMLQHYMNNQFAALNYQKLASAAYVLSICIVILVWLIYRRNWHES
ncbi:MAG TPA: sugar ABC transporter permease [Clostridiales bacterium]|nr:sugar ABC transporter permease [Clostridiales bacterium]